MDFDGFILVYAADGVECEGEIWIYNFDIFIIHLNSFSIDEIMNYWME